MKLTVKKFENCSVELKHSKFLNRFDKVIYGNYFSKTFYCLKNFYFKH